MILPKYSQISKLRVLTTIQAVDVVDPELAKEERRRSAERRSAEYRRTHGLPTDSYQHSNNSAYYGREHSPPRDYHQEHHYGTHLDVSPPRVPPHGGNSRGASRERLHNTNNYSPQPQQRHGFPAPYASSHASDPYSSEGYSPDHYPQQSYSGVQRPQPSHAYSPPETGHAAGYFPNNAYDRRDYEGHYPSTERLVGPRQQPYSNI